MEDTLVLSRELKNAGVNVIDCSSGGLTEQTRALPVPRGFGFQVPFAREVRRHAGVLTQAVGLIFQPEQAEQILQEESADLIAIGRAALLDPYWALHAQEVLCPDSTYSDWPLRHGIWLSKRQPVMNSIESKKLPNRTES